MPQIYHANAKTNIHVRMLIKESNESPSTLSKRHGVSCKTIRKHRKARCVQDKSSRPNKITYALSTIEQTVIVATRKATWMAIDDLVDMVSPAIPKANKSNVYRTLKAHGVNKVPEERKKQAKKFKEYEPGYIHIDVTYLPKLNGLRQYLFVAIDRATRLLHYRVYNHKTAENAVAFLTEVQTYFPFYITHILTDNGLEFTDKFVSKEKEVTGKHIFDQTCKKYNVEHRLTQPNTPQTNGMVERVNGTIKNSTVKATEFESLEAMAVDLDKFLIYYNFTRTHTSLKRELKVKTPFQALCAWYEIKPEIFKFSPKEFEAMCEIFREQRCET